MNTFDRTAFALAVYQFFKTFYKQFDQLEKADVSFVFARADVLFARTAFSLYRDSLVENVLLTGGLGKDSGNLSDIGLTEAGYLAALMYSYGTPSDKLIVEQKAKNGAENSEFGIQMILRKGIPHRQVILVGHPTSLLRLYAVHTLKAKSVDFHAGYQLVATPDEGFDPSDSEQQQNIFAEFNRLIQWPAKNWADPIHIPTELLEGAKKIP